MAKAVSFESIRDNRKYFCEVYMALQPLFVAIFYCNICSC
jgi:hypothetical protein